MTGELAINSYKIIKVVNFLLLFVGWSISNRKTVFLTENIEGIANSAVIIFETNWQTPSKGFYMNFTVTGPPVHYTGLPDEVNTVVNVFRVWCVSLR